ALPVTCQPPDGRRRGQPAQSWWGEGKAIQDADTGSRMRVVHVEVGERPAQEHIAEALGVPVGAAVLTRSRRFAVGGRGGRTANSHAPREGVGAAPAMAYPEPGRGGWRPGGVQGGGHLPRAHDSGGDGFVIAAWYVGARDPPPRLHRRPEVRRGERDG